MKVSERRNRMESDLTVYPKICNAEELTNCLPDSGIVEACGFERPEEKRILERMLSAIRKGKEILLIDRDKDVDDWHHQLQSGIHRRSLIVCLEKEPIGWPVEGTLLCVDGVKDSQRERLLQKLYEADHRVLGLVMKQRTKK